jgi:hypothetical protein
MPRDPIFAAYVNQWLNLLELSGEHQAILARWMLDPFHRDCHIAMGRARSVGGSGFFTAVTRRTASPPRRDNAIGTLLAARRQAGA